jgi:hypothetical protein
MQTNRHIWLVDREPVSLRHAEAGDVSCGVDHLNGLNESSVSGQVQGDGALHQASLIWRIHKNSPIPLMIEIMGFLGGEL